MLNWSLLHALWRAPGRVGTVLPSSARLGKQMAQLAARFDAGGSIIEAGAGTGALTAALLETFGMERVTAIERDATLCQQLRKRFPTAQIQQDSLEAVLGQLAPRPKGVVLVSSIPWRSLRDEHARPILAKLSRFIIGGGTLVQFSYGIRPPFAPPAGAEWVQHGRIWWNLPPAKLWVLQRSPSQAAQARFQQRRQALFADVPALRSPF